MLGFYCWFRWGMETSMDGNTHSAIWVDDKTGIGWHVWAETNFIKCK